MKFYLKLYVLTWYNIHYLPGCRGKLSVLELAYFSGKLLNIIFIMSYHIVRQSLESKSLVYSNQR